MTKRGFVLLAVFGLLAGAWWLQRGVWLSARLRAPIERALESALRRPVRIGGVGGGLGGWLWLHDVQVGPSTVPSAWDLSFTAEAVGLKLDAWALWRGRTDLAGLRAAQIVAPNFFVLKSAASLSLTAKPSALASGSKDWRTFIESLHIPPVPLQLERGRVWVPVPKQAPQLWISNLYVSLEPQGAGSWHVRASGKPGGTGEASVSARCGPSFADAKLEGDAKDLQWPVWLPVPVGLSRPTGRLSGELTARPLRGAWAFGWDVEAHGTVDDVSAQQSGRPGVTNLGARWTLRGPDLSFTDIQGIYGGGGVRGEASVNFSAGVFGATLTAQAVELGVVAGTLGAPANLGLRGAADLDFLASGPFAAPTASLEIRSLAARWREHPLTGLDFQVSGGGGTWSGDGTMAWDGGRGTLSVDLDGSGLKRATLEVAALPVDWLEAFIGHGLRGRVDGTGQYSRPRGAWQVALAGTGLSVGGAPVNGVSMQASGDDHSAHVRAAADLVGRPGLNAGADAERQGKGAWNLQAVKLYQRARLLVQAHGVFNSAIGTSPAGLELSIRTVPLELELLNPALVVGGWGGKVRASGTVGFGGGAWHGSFRASSATLSRHGWTYPGALSFGFGPGGVSVTVRSMRGGEVQGHARAPAWSGPWSGAWTLSKARLAAYANVLDAGVPRGLSGWASGDLSFSAGPSGSLFASLIFHDPLPTVLPGASGHVDLRREGGLWNIRSLVVKQRRGFLTGQAQFDLNGRAPWSGHARWNNLCFSGLTFSGALSLGTGGPGRVVLAPWSLSATALPRLDATFQFKNGALSSVQGSLGPSLHWSVTPLAGEWTVQTLFAGFDPGPWASFFREQGRPTDLRLAGGLRCSLSKKGLVDAAADLRDQGGGSLEGRWRLVSGTAEVRGGFKFLNLERLSRVCGDVGIKIPALGGLASGSLQGGAAGITLSASVDDLVWNHDKLGTAAILMGWANGRVWISDAMVGPQEGPYIKVHSAVLLRSGRTWNGSGKLDFSAWPVGLWTLGGDAALRASGGGGKLRWDARCGRLDVGLRRWTKLDLSGTWNGLTYTVLEGSRVPAFSASGTYGAGIFTLAEARAFSGHGRGSLRGRIGAHGSLDFSGISSGLPASDLAGIMGWPQDWTGAAWGSLKVSGTMGKAHTVVSAKVEDGSVDGLPFDLGTGLVVQDGDWVDLSPVDPLRISRRDGTALEVRGRVTLLDDPPPGKGMDVRAELRRGGLRLFAGLPAIQAADGPLSLKLHFTGKPADPRVDGTVLVTDGSLVPAWLLPKLVKVRILAQISASKVTLGEADARVGEGGPLLTVEAADPSKPAFVFKDWVPAEMNLRVRAGKSGIPLRFTPALTFVSGNAHPDLVLSGSWKKPGLGGTVSLDKGSQDKAVVQWPAQFQGASGDQAGSWFQRLNYNLGLKARSDVMVRTGAAEIFVDTGDKGILVRGSGGDKGVYGHLRLVQGSVDYLLATFQVAQDHESWLDLRGGGAPEVELWGFDDLGDVTLAGEGAPRDIQILLHAWGPIGQVSMRLEDENDPSLSQDQLAAVLGMGGSSGDPRSQSGFTRMLGSVPAGFLTALARKTGLLDVVGLSVPAVDQAIAPTPQVGDTGQMEALATPTSATAKSLLEVSAGKYFGSKLFLGMNTEVMQHTDPLGRSQINPEVGGVVQYQLPGSSRLSVERNVDTFGETDNRVMLEGSSQFSNYNPNQRRWDGSPTSVPTPSPLPTSTPTQTPTPQVSPTIGPDPRF